MTIEDRFINPDVESLSIHAFKGVLYDYALGEKTRAEALAALNRTLESGIPLAAPEQADLNTLADAIDAISGLQDKLLYCLEIEIVLLQATDGADYLTAVAIRTRLGL